MFPKPAESLLRSLLCSWIIWCFKSSIWHIIFQRRPLKFPICYSTIEICNSSDGFLGSSSIYSHKLWLGILRLSLSNSSSLCSSILYMLDLSLYSSTFLENLRPIYKSSIYCCWLWTPDIIVCLSFLVEKTRFLASSKLDL